MKREMKIEDVIEFQKEYTNNKENIKIENDIKKLGLKKACLDKELPTKYKYEFNIEIPKVKSYDQKNSVQCNIYAFLRVIKSIMQKENPTIDINTLDLSANYLDFYDKLEKINTCYEELLSLKKVTLEDINRIVNRYVGIYGTFHYCRELVKKYGLVPTKIMEEASENYDAFKQLELLKAKIKTDAMVLLEKNKKSKEEIKIDLLKEAYNFLSKTKGNPPVNFKWKGKTNTPLEFKNNILKSNLDEYITVVSFDKKTFINSEAYIPNVYLNNTEKIKALDIEKIKESVIKQLSDGIAVWFSSEESTTLDYNVNILDSHIYKYNELLNIKERKKEEKLILDLTNYDHAMCITGALVHNGKAKQFKVDNSFGNHGRYQGHLIMTNTFFETDIIALIINEKYL